MSFLFSPTCGGLFFVLHAVYCALAVLYPRGPAYKGHHVGALLRALLQHVCDKAPYAKALPYYGSYGEPHAAHHFPLIGYGK